HLLRPLVGHAPDRLLPMSLVAGALLLLCTDIATRLLSPIANLQVGVVTALLGAPFFLALLMRLRRSLQ
ncbi:MAG: iron chelate uptake ABC transporter family permease subunit, partial [Gammaproteobacteria bacterium]|nr:iron chelate uptake ABC transporter family permease subunit [Gammaproteobacteria bacterium]